MNPSDEFIKKILNLWFHKETPRDDFSDTLKNFAGEIVHLLKYGDDKIFGHPKINEIILVCKDYGLIEYDKTIMEIYFEGKMRVQLKLRQIFNSPEVSTELQALTNVLGNMLKKIQSEAQKNIDKDKNRSAIPELVHKKFYKN